MGSCVTVRVWGAIALATCWSLACGGVQFGCDDDSACGSDGRCEVEGFCSFPDPTCPSGWRFGAHAGFGLARTCVPIMGADAGTATTALTPGSSGTSGGGTGSSGGLVQTDTTGAPSGTSSTAAATTGPDTSSSTGTPIPRVTDDLQVLYLFDEGSGTTVFDQSGVGTPLDLTMMGTFGWVADGLESLNNGVALSADPADKIRLACEASNEITVEAWITPADALQFGPARIATVSPNGNLRNFTLGQGSFDGTPGWVGRLRTTAVSDNGTPELLDLTMPVEAPTHVVYYRAATGEEGIYLDAVQGQTAVRAGDLSNWDPAYVFAVANEPSLDRRFDGVFHLVAVYSRALSEAEIDQNFAAGF